MIMTGHSRCFPALLCYPGNALLQLYWQGSCAHGCCGHPLAPLHTQLLVISASHTHSPDTLTGSCGVDLALNLDCPQADSEMRAPTCPAAHTAAAHAASSTPAPAAPVQSCLHEHNIGVIAGMDVTATLGIQRHSQLSWSLSSLKFQAHMMVTTPCITFMQPLKHQ